MNAILGNLLWLTAATQSPANFQSPPPPDLEVVGRLENLDYETIDDPDDILGHGWITAKLRISRVLRGRSPSRFITIRYLAHTYRTESSPVRLKLRANANGTYTVCAPPGGEGLVCG
jgi:integration host factor subunit beta